MHEKNAKMSDQSFQMIGETEKLEFAENAIAYRLAVARK